MVRPQHKYPVTVSRLRARSQRDAIPGRRQFLSEREQNLTVFVLRFAQALSKFMKVNRVLALASPNDVV